MASKSYTTIAGDTFDIVAYKAYKDCYRVNELMAANEKYINVSTFGAGVVLNLPEIDTSTAAILPPWKK